MHKGYVLLLAIVLTGCGGIPSVPYVEPPQSAETARVRVITNSSVFGDSITADCAPKLRHKMAESGRQRKNGQPHPSYPQYPLQTEKIDGMPKRMAPKMIDLQPAIRMAEGMYVEVETEHRVPTSAPFQIATLGAVMGTYLSTNPVCHSDAEVFVLEPDTDYEVFVGMHRVKTPESSQLYCMLTVRKLLPIGETGLSLPVPIEGKPAPERWCKD